MFKWHLRYFAARYLRQKSVKKPHLGGLITNPSSDYLANQDSTSAEPCSAFQAFSNL